MARLSQHFGVLLLCIMSTAISAAEIKLLALFNNRAMVSVDGGKQIVLKVGVEKQGVRLISANSQTKKAVVMVGGKEKTLALGSGSYTSGYAKSKQAKQVQIVKNNYGMYTTPGSINGRAVYFLVDTGATSVAMNANEAKRLGIPFRLKGIKTQVSTASGVARAYAIKLKKVQVGTIKLTNVDAVVVDGTSPTEVLLGMSFLGQLQVLHEGNRLIIKKKY